MMVWDEGRRAITALVGATLIDGRGRTPMSDATILIEGDRIAAVGAGTVEVPAEASVVDVSGAFVIPGLIDVHVHYFEWMGEMFLAHGVTTVKDVGNDVEWIATAAAEVSAGAARGPRIHYTGNGLDVPPPRRDHFIGIEGEEMARRVVALLHEHGAMAIKVREMMPIDILAPIVDEAHRLGLKVTGHLRAMGAGEAAEVGIDGLEHASGIVQATLDPWLRVELDALEASDIYAKYVAERMAYALIGEHRGAQIVRDLAQREVALIPTMSGWWRMATPRRDDFRREDAEYADHAGLAYVPEAARSIWATSNLYQIDDPDHLAQLHTGYRRIEQLLRQHRDAGGRVLAGSDTYLSVPGLSLQRELLFLTDMGFAPGEAISIATYENAVFMGIEHDVGSIEVGKLADLVVLAADPLAAIENIARIRSVYVGGQEVDISYHADHAVPTPRPEMVRPLWVERRLVEEGYEFRSPSFDLDGSPAVAPARSVGGGSCC